MKRFLITTFCLLTFFVEGQQNNTDSSWSNIKNGLHSISKKLQKSQKLGEKKVELVKQLEVQTVVDTLLIGLDYDDSLSVYLDMKAKFDSIEKSKEPKKEREGFFKFLRKKKSK